MSPREITITLSVGDYDRTRPLVDGRVRPQGIELKTTVLPSPKRHWQMLREHAFDACEMSMVSFLMISERSDDFVGVPIFPHRRFRHSFLFVGDHIQRPEDLVGARVGSRTFQNTTSVWMRGILQDHYGVPIDSLTWFAQDEDDVPLPADVASRVIRTDPGATVDQLLHRGELDAVISPHILEGFLLGWSNIRRLFADFEREEQQYFAKTGHFPIMHTLIVKREVLEKYPFISKSLYDAFEKAKQIALAELVDPRRWALVWAHAQWQRERAVLGDDPWLNGIEANRKTLDQLALYCKQQGLIKEMPDWSRLFPEVG